MGPPALGGTEMKTAVSRILFVVPSKLFLNITKTDTKILADSMDSRPRAYNENYCGNSILFFCDYSDSFWKNPIFAAGRIISIEVVTSAWFQTSPVFKIIVSWLEPNLWETTDERENQNRSKTSQFKEQLSLTDRVTWTILRAEFLHDC